MKRCTYCNLPIGTIIAFNDRLDYLQEIYDHFIPKVLGGTESQFNLTLCCQVCNNLKGYKRFKDSAEVREHVRKNYTYTEVSKLQSDIFKQTQRRKIPQQSLQMAVLESAQSKNETRYRVIQISKINIPQPRNNRSRPKIYRNWPRIISILPYNS